MSSKRDEIVSGREGASESERETNNPVIGLPLLPSPSIQIHHRKKNPATKEKSRVLKGNLLCFLVNIVEGLIESFRDNFIKISFKNHFIFQQISLFQQRFVVVVVFVVVVWKTELKVNTSR